MTGPAALDGVTVVELGDGVSAPFAARLFADYGANVLKVERAGTGDTSRSWGPFPNDVADPEASGLFFFCNTGKRSVEIDLETDEGRAMFLRLIAQADVFVENQRPSEMRRLGLDHASLAAVNPDLVMVSITPFGQVGPYADWLAHDLNAYHLTATGSRYCGAPDRAPLEHGTFSADFFGGYVAVAWALGALMGRSTIGGQHLDVSTAEAIAALFTGAQNIGPYAQEGRFGRRSGTGMSIAAPAKIMPCRDGFVWLIALEASQWDGLCAAMGNPEWSKVELFRDLLERGRNSDFLYEMIEQWTLTMGKQEIMDLCQEHRCPTTAIFSIDELVDHPHLVFRGQRVELDHPVLGTVPVFGAPILLPDCPGGPQGPAPLLGQHTAEVLDSVSAIGPVRVGRSIEAADLLGNAERSGRGESAYLPLAGLRVANFGQSWVGPVAGQTLSFLGAEVYKIESHAKIDINRTLPPFAEGIASPDRSLQNHAGWAGNGSVTLDLRDPRGRDLARRLVAECDVVLENFGPGVMNRLGLGYEELCAVRPGLIYVSMPAAGLDGPMSSVRTYGTSLCSIAGLDSITGYDASGPVTMENAFADPLGGVVGAIGAMLALMHRDATGRGQHVDYSQQEGILQLMGPAAMDLALNGRVAGPMDNRHPLGAGAPHGLFPCSGEDRWVSIAVLSEVEWQGLRTAMGEPAWAADPELGTTSGRLRRLDEIHRHLAEWTIEFDDRELSHLLQGHGVAAAPVLNVADLLHDEYYRARHTFIEVTHPLGFTETIYGSYVKASRTVPRVRPGPAMGQDNEHVFLELLGLSRDDYDALVAAGVID
jgi:benzylsuccinate CoA-transferase BbsF subunit